MGRARDLSGVAEIEKRVGPTQHSGLSSPENQVKGQAAQRLESASLQNPALLVVAFLKIDDPAAVGRLVREIEGVKEVVIKVAGLGARVDPGGKDPGNIYHIKLVLELAVVVELALGPDGRA